MVLSKQINIVGKSITELKIQILKFYKHLFNNQFEAFNLICKEVKKCKGSNADNTIRACLYIQGETDEKGVI